LAQQTALAISKIPTRTSLSGVVLSTGDVTKVPSNDRILSDGSNSWTGDTDLENNLLSQSGITINSINATYIEFDFQPKTPNFDFSFLFAEEYGTSQCNFQMLLLFIKGCDCGRIKSKSPIPIFLFQLKLSR
jgi:predicted flavoprotein YhiN